jgi:septal ring-binding cell division protein DamX
MAIFQNNILKQEETVGGFEPNLEGDETFALNNLDVYPADLPDFGDFESFKIPEPELVESAQVVETPETADDSANIWEQMFTGESEPADSLPAPVSDSVDLDDLFASDAEPTTNIQDEIPDESPIEESVPDLAFADESISAANEEALMAEMMKEEAVSDSIKNLVVESDPVIQEEKVPVIDSPVLNEETVSKDDPFLDVEALKEAVEIDLSVLPDHPTTAHIKSTEPTKEEAKAEEPEIKKVKKPMNKKLLRRIATYSSIALILIGGGSALYYFGAIDAVKHLIAGSHVQQDSTQSHNNAKTDNHSAHSAEATKHEASHADSTKKEDVHSKDEHDEAKKDEHTTAAEPASKDEHTAPSNKHEELKKEVAKHEESKHDNKEKVKSEEKHKEVKKEVKIEKNAKEKKREPKVASDLHKDDKKTIKKEKATKAINPKVSKKSIENKPDLGELYSIQIYASPSKEDAQEWVKKVKRKNSDVYISTQVIRDKVWYRVRCGHYSNKEEAKNAAEKLGFSQSWVDRIR